MLLMMIIVLAMAVAMVMMEVIYLFIIVMTMALISDAANDDYCAGHGSSNSNDSGGLPVYNSDDDGDN